MKTVSSKSRKSTTSAHHVSTEAAPVASAASVLASSAPPTPALAAHPAALSFAERVIAAVAAISQARTLLDLPDPSSVAEVKRSIKLKKGGETQVPKLASLSTTYNVSVPSRPTATMIAQLEQATQLEPAKAAIEELALIVNGFYFSSRSETWATATSLYSMLKKGSTREPKLAAALGPMQEYFAYRHPSVAKAKPTAATKAATKAQLRVQKQIEKLQGQLAKLQSTQSPAEEAPAPEAAPPAQPAPAPAVVTTHTP